jgi:hypothetical protein
MGYGRVGLCVDTPPKKVASQVRIDDPILINSSDEESEMLEGEGVTGVFVGGPGCERKVVCISPSLVLIQSGLSVT